MYTLINGEACLRIWLGQQYGEWTLKEIFHIHSGPTFGTHMFTFTNGDITLHTSNQHWSGDTLRAKCNAKWVRCPEVMRLFSERYTKVIADIEPLAK